MNRIGAVASALLTVTPAMAEIVDKIPSSPDNWEWAIIGSIVGVALIRFRWWAAIPSFLLTIVRLFAAILEWHSPDVGPAIARELGSNYGIHAYAALAVVLATHLGAWCAGLHRVVVDRRGRGIAAGALLILSLGYAPPAAAWRKVHSVELIDNRNNTDFERRVLQFRVADARVMELDDGLVTDRERLAPLLEERGNHSLPTVPGERNRDQEKQSKHRR